MTNNREASPKSLESLEQFYSSLQELLAGARNNYRMDVHSDLHVEIMDGNRKCKGRLLNLSTAGASIELVTFDKLPRIKSVVNMLFPFPELSEHLYVDARIVWTKDQTNNDRPHHAIIGVTFIGIDENAQNCIWNYILDNAPAPLQRTLNIS
jgi:c-di-GMP-binding flagellar brake protein YcgR